MPRAKTIIVGVHETKTRLSELARMALEENADVIIIQHNKPVMRLVLHQEKKKDRGFGAMKGQIEMSDNTPKDLIDSLYGDTN